MLSVPRDNFSKTLLRCRWISREVGYLVSQVQSIREVLAFKVLAWREYKPWKDRQAMEIKCYRKILHIPYKHHVTNEEVRAKIQQAKTTRRPPDDRKETQTVVVWSCLPFIRSGQNHLARHSERRKKTRQTEQVVGRHQGMDRTGVRQVPEGSREQGKMEETGCEIIRGASTTLAVKG